MGKKKRQHPDIEEILARPWCYYCERDFDDLKILISHQKAKHFKCDRCGRRLNTAGGLSVHMNQVHKEQLGAVENALEGRERLDLEIFGMEGIPEDVLQAHNQKVMQQFHEAQVNRQAVTGNPVPGAQSGAVSAPKKPKFESPAELKKRLAEHRAKKAAGELTDETTPSGTPTTQTASAASVSSQQDYSASAATESSQPDYGQAYGQPPYSSVPLHSHIPPNQYGSVVPPQFPPHPPAFPGHPGGPGMVPGMPFPPPFPAPNYPFPPGSIPPRPPSHIAPGFPPAAPFGGGGGYPGVPPPFAGQFGHNGRAFPPPPGPPSGLSPGLPSGIPSGLPSRPTGSTLAGPVPGLPQRPSYPGVSSLPPIPSLPSNGAAYSRGDGSADHPNGDAPTVSASTAASVDALISSFAGDGDKSQSATSAAPPPAGKSGGKKDKEKSKDRPTRLVYTDNEVSPEEKMAKWSRFATSAIRFHA